MIAFSNEAHIFFASTNDTLRRFIRDENAQDQRNYAMTQEIQIKFDVEQDKKTRDDKMRPTFAFIICQPGKERLVMRKLQTLKSVKEIQKTHGKYDILVKLENMTEVELREIMNREILHMEVVLSVMNLTSTCVA